MSKLFRKLFDIHEGEGLKASLMFSSIFLLIASLMIVKPVRTSLFLVEFGVGKLPYVFILVALFSAIVASIYSKYSRKVRLNYLMLAILLISIACLLVFWFLLHFGYKGSWFLYAFYVWVSIFAVTIGAQFWLMANYIFNAREARRLFGFIGAGAISGGIFGGYLTNYLAPRLKTENLIFFCIGFLIICMPLLWLAWKKSARYSLGERVFKQKRTDRLQETDNPIKLILHSRHLAFLTGIIGVGVIVANLAEYQFNDLASRAITDADQLTAFFGKWMSNLSIASLVIQLLLTGRILKHFGVTASLFFLPIGLLVGAFAILFNPALWSAILIKVSDGSLKHSINKAGTELLILPIPSAIKNKAKAFIDVFIKNFSKGIGGILLIVLMAILGSSVQYISLVIIGLIAVWTYLIVKVRSEYVNSFRLAIEKRTIDIEQQSLNLEDAAVFQSFVKALDGKSERQILYVLNLLEGVKNKELIPYLRRLIKHSSDEIKAFVLRVALQYEELDLAAEARNLTGSQDQIVQIEAIHYLCERSDDKTSTLKAYLNNDDFRINGAAMMCASSEWKASKSFRKEIDMKGILDKMFKSLRQKDHDDAQKQYMKINTAKVIGETNNPELFPYLHILLNDESLDVVQAAITSIGEIRDKEFVPILITHLNTKHVRKCARESLAEYGEDIIEELAELLENSDEDRKKRLAMPRVLALIGSQKSVTILSDNLDQRDLFLRYQIIKALNKLRVKFPMLKFDMPLVKERILAEIDQYIQTLTLLHRQNSLLSTGKADESSSDKDTDRIKKARGLLTIALEEKLDNNLERIFRLLGLKYPPRDMYNSYLGIKSEKSYLRANSIEFLDNILEISLKKIIIPIVEKSPTEFLLDNTQKLFGVNIPSETECFNLILEGDDNWLKGCTLFLVAELNDDRPIDAIAKLVDDPDPVVKETSKYSLKKMGISN